MMRRFVIALVTILLASTAAPDCVGVAQTSAPDGQIEIHGTIAAKGRYVFSWIEKNLCSIQFWDYDYTPELVVTDGAGKQLGSLSVASLPGTVTMEGPTGNQHAEICQAAYTLSVPPSDAYRVKLDPYFKSDLLSRDDLTKPLDIKFERQKDSPGPDFHKRPSGPIPGADRFRIAGTLELLAPGGFTADPADMSFLSMALGGCVTMGGYQDIKIGAQITIKDETGKIIGVGELEPIYTADDKCQFAFIVDVPSAAFYSISMERRGQRTYSKQDLADRDWRLDLTIGSGS